MRRRRPLKNNTRKWLAAPYSVWAVGFIIIPLFVILYYAFTSEEGALTKENRKALGISLWLSFLSTVICLVLA